MRKHLLLNLLLVILFGMAYGQGPNITGLSPIDNATSIPIQSQFRIFFDANIQKGVGAIEIRQWENDAVVETIDVNSVRVTILNAVATISPTVALSTASAYYITVEPGAIESLAGEPFVGFTDNATWNFTTICGPGPVNLGGATTNYTAVLNWDEVSGAEDYQLWVSHIGVIPSTDGDNFYVLNDLAPGYTYDWTVKYRCASLDNMVYSDSSFSQFRTRGTNSCANTPVGLNAAVTKESATLTWNAVAGVTYDIFVNGLGVVAENVSGNTYELTGLTPGTDYQFSVRSVCAEYLKSEWSGTFYFRTISECVSPTSLIASSITDNSAVLSWEGYSGALGYHVLINGERIDVGTANSYVVEGLSSGTRYTWAVKTICPNSGESVWVYDKFTTTGPNNCLVPSNLVASSVTDNSAVLSWESSPGAASYMVLINGERIDVGTANSYVVEGLSSGMRYTWAVKTICPNSGESVWVYERFNTMDKEENQFVIIPEGQLQLDEKFEIEQEESLKISLHPNPSVGPITVAVEGDDKITAITIFNTRGTPVKEIHNLNTVSETINFEAYGSGIYLIRIVVNNNQLVTDRVIIQ